MNKEAAIQALIKTLPLNECGWIPVDHWEADLCAIGIARSDRSRQLVYVSTYGKLPGRYDYQCEMPAGPHDDDYVTTASGEDVDTETLLAVIKDHLAVTPDEVSGKAV